MPRWTSPSTATGAGRTIDLYDSRSRESVLAALQLSGNRNIMRICIELAAEHGFKLANPELRGIRLDPE
jgi:hypothetical protein